MSLYSILKEKFPEGKLVSNNTEFLMRCPFCGDSRKDRSDAHFYISLRDDKPHFYNCFLCGTKGVLNRRLLRYIGIYDEEAVRLVSKKVDMKFTPLKYRKVYIPKAREQWEIDKLYYIANRLGSKRFGRYLDKLRIVTNLQKLIEYNRLPIQSLKQVNFLDRNYIGFLLEDKSSVLLRKITDNEYGKRWFRYNLFDSDCSTYAIECKLECPVEPKVYMAEGVLDIISIYTNSTDKERSEGLYYAIGNRNYLGNIKNIMQRIPSVHLEFHVFIDNDINMNTLVRSIIKDLSPMNTFLDIILHRNEFQGEKDYGVPLERIKDVRYKII